MACARSALLHVTLFRPLRKSATLVCVWKPSVHISRLAWPRSTMPTRRTRRRGLLTASDLVVYFTYTSRSCTFFDTCFYRRFGKGRYIPRYICHFALAPLLLLLFDMFLCFDDLTPGLSILRHIGTIDGHVFRTCRVALYHFSSIVNYTTLFNPPLHINVLYLARWRMGDLATCGSAQGVPVTMATVA
jgi:hypothetical protein